MLIDIKTVQKYIENKIPFSIGRHGISFDCINVNDVWCIKCQRARMRIWAVDLWITEGFLKGDAEPGVTGLSIDLSDYELLCRIYLLDSGEVKVREKVR